MLYFLLRKLLIFLPFFPLFMPFVSLMCESSSRFMPLRLSPGLRTYSNESRCVSECLPSADFSHPLHNGKQFLRLQIGLNSRKSHVTTHFFPGEQRATLCVAALLMANTWDDFIIMLKSVSKSIWVKKTSPKYLCFSANYDELNLATMAHKFQFFFFFRRKFQYWIQSSARSRASRCCLWQQLGPLDETIFTFR